MSVTNVPYGMGYDEASATAYASELARLCDQLNSYATYALDTYSPYSSDEIASYWAQGDAPTEEQIQKANEFKSWLDTVNTMIDAAMEGDVGYQIKKWRQAGVSVVPPR